MKKIDIGTKYHSDPFDIMWKSTLKSFIDALVQKQSEIEAKSTQNFDSKLSSNILSFIHFLIHDSLYQRATIVDLTEKLKKFEDDYLQEQRTVRDRLIRQKAATENVQREFYELVKDLLASSGYGPLVSTEELTSDGELPDKQE